MTEKEFCKLHTSYYGEPIDKTMQLAMISFNGEELKHYVEHFVRLCGVSRSIGESTQDTLMEMTEKQKKINYVSCLLCKYKTEDMESDVCQKCMEENNENQYYG